MKNSDEVPVLELKRLLHELKDLRPDILVRFRLIGEMWQSSFTRLVKITEHGLIVSSEGANELHVIANLNDIIQFEIDSAFQIYKPHFHYSVVPQMIIRDNYANTGC